MESVWGPANLIYMPDDSFIGSDNETVHYLLSAVPQNPETTKLIIAGSEKHTSYRSHKLTVDYGNILVLSQPSENACVHVIDSRWPRYSMFDSDSILLAGNYSDINLISVEGKHASLDPIIFGKEINSDSWCYYYQQAEMALQKEDWKTISDLENSALEQSLHPNDRIEWMPFLQAAFVRQDKESIETIAAKINEDIFLRKQACTTLLNMSQQTNLISTETLLFGKSLFCR